MEPSIPNEDGAVVLFPEVRQVEKEVSRLKSELLMQHFAGPSEEHQTKIRNIVKKMIASLEEIAVTYGGNYFFENDEEGSKAYNLYNSGKGCEADDNGYSIGFVPGNTN